MKCFCFLVVLALLASLCPAQSNVYLESCTLSCGGRGTQIIQTPREVGPPGKAGAKGGRGSPGLTGLPGPAGPPGESCSCSGYAGLKTEIEQLKQSFSTLLMKLVQDVKKLGYTERAPGLWYKLYSNQVNYERAKQICEVDGGRLASKGLRNSNTRRQVMSIVTARAWVGLDDLQVSNRYVWSDGVNSTTDNTDWYKGEPNGNEEHCVEAYTSTYNYQLNDIDCARTFATLCEIALPL